MVLNPNQTELQFLTLYKVQSMGEFVIERGITASIWADSGSINIYASDSATPPTAISEMTLNSEDAGISGKVIIESLPSYIAITQSAGTTTEIILSGIETTDLGDIS